MRVCELRDDITVANIALVLIHQADYLLRQLIEKHKQDFLENGGINEQMSAARRSWREEHGMGYLNGNHGSNGNHGKNWNNDSWSNGSHANNWKNDTWNK